MIAGQPGAGKSTFAKELRTVYPQSKYLAQDTIKEFLFDLLGFQNLIQKEQLIELSRTMFYSCCEYCLNNKQQLIIDYPFSEVQLAFLEEMVGKYSLEVQTYVLYGDDETLYNRVKERETEDRHQGHQATCYPIKDKTQDYQMQTFEQYQAKSKERNYSSFKFHNTVQINTAKVNINEYKQIIAKNEGVSS